MTLEQQVMKIFHSAAISVRLLFNPSWIKSILIMLKSTLKWLMCSLMTTRSSIEQQNKMKLNTDWPAGWRERQAISKRHIRVWMQHFNDAKPLEVCRRPHIIMFPTVPEMNRCLNLCKSLVSLLENSDDQIFYLLILIRPFKTLLMSVVAP